MPGDVVRKDCLYHAPRRTGQLVVGVQYVHTYCTQVPSDSEMVRCCSVAVLADRL